MNNDVVPSLIEKVFNAYNESIANSSQIKAFYELLDKNKATMQDVQKYSKLLGVLASKAILKTITKDELPNGILYWNIAERVLTPLFEDIHKKVAESYAIVQKRMDKKIGINLKPIEAPFPNERIRDLIDVLVNAFNDTEND